MFEYQNINSAIKMFFSLIELNLAVILGQQCIAWMEKNFANLLVMPMLGKNHARTFQQPRS